MNGYATTFPFQTTGAVGIHGVPRHLHHPVHAAAAATAAAAEQRQQQQQPSPPSSHLSVLQVFIQHSRPCQQTIPSISNPAAAAGAAAAAQAAAAATQQIHLPTHGYGKGNIGFFLNLYEP